MTKSEERKIDTSGWKSATSGGRISSPTWKFREEAVRNRCLQSFREGVSLLGHVAWMLEGSDTRSLLVADVPDDFWRRPRGRLRSSWLRTVREDLDLMETSLEGGISFANMVLWRQMVDDITYRATLPMRK